MPRLSDRELAERHLGLGASDIPELLGLAPWDGAGPMRLWLEKTGQSGPREPDPDREEAMEWGHELEPLISRWYARRHAGVTLLPGGHVPHREIPWLWATLDAKAPDRILEVKNVGGGMAHHWSATADDGVPRYVRVQCVVGQACLGTRLTDVAACIAGRAPRVWTVAWDEELWDVIRDRASAFWALVQSRTPPALDATDATKEWLRRTYPGGEDRALIPSDFAAEGLAERRIYAALERRKAEDTMALADHELLHRIGDADGMIAQDGSWKMTWKLDKNGKRRQRFTARALRDE